MLHKGTLLCCLHRCCCCIPSLTAPSSSTHHPIQEARLRLLLGAGLHGAAAQLMKTALQLSGAS
jgi:hypothetical protein